MELGQWTWLEIAKLGTQALTPFLVVGLGIYVHRITKKFEYVQWQNQKLIEKRLSIYDKLATELNDLLCYFTYVGKWKDVKPPEVVSKKREIDKQIYLSAPLFSQDFFNACHQFQSLCFDTYNGMGKDAKLRTKYDERAKAMGTAWDSSWAECFSDRSPHPAEDELRTAYQKVMDVFASEIGAKESARIIPLKYK